ncbi:MAG: efflux RND transporter periplasmic adaptor subunit [Phycisphaerae bacterium]
MAGTAPLTAAPRYGAAATQNGERGRARRWMILSAVLLVALVPLALLGSNSFFDRFLTRAGWSGGVHEVQPVTLNIVLTENGELKPKKSVDVKCEVEGQSTLLFVVPESTRVAKGDLLVELASDQLVEKLETEEIELRKARTDLEAATQELAITRNENASKIKKAEIDLEVARLDLEQYLKGDYEKALKSADIDIQQTQLDITRKKDELRKNKALAEKGFVTPSKLEELEFDLQKTQLALEMNQLTKRILLEYDRPKAEKLRTSAVEQAEQELEREKARSDSREKQAVAKEEAARAQLGVRETRIGRVRRAVERCKIYAPADGVVQYPADEGNWRSNSSRIAAGEKVYEGQTLIMLPDTTQMVVSTRIHEADRHKVREGLRCIVTVPAVPGKTFNGTIAKITQFADSAHRWLNPDLKEHATEILLDETNAPISPGDSAEIRILVEDVANVLAVPVQSVFARGSRTFVFVLRGGAPEPQEVKVGRASTTLVEVVSGLSAGDRVLMQANEGLLAKLPSIAPSPALAEAEPAPEAPRPPPGNAANPGNAGDNRGPRRSGRSG